MKKKAELVFIPAPAMGHFVSMAEFAKRLLDRDQRLSITILVISAPFSANVDAYARSLAATNTSIRFINLPLVEPPSSQDLISCPEKFVSVFLESHKPLVKDAITNNILSSSSSDEPILAGLVIDFFCTSMIDVADQLGVPSYLFFTSSAAFLGFMLFLPTRHAQIGAEFEPSEPDSIVPGYANPVPASVAPGVVLNKEGGYTSFLNHAMRFKETKGMVINTFYELEPHAVDSIIRGNGDETVSVYTVGPLLDLEGGGKQFSSGSDEILQWLDEQPPSSVVFLCFGSMGTFGTPQLGEMATALERSGHRFLWSIRQPPPKEKFDTPGEFTNMEEILPEGFLKRTEKRGKVCGWAPQVEVLAHKAVGGFVSHCGWNSILESLWYGVPIVTWPMYAEQQINAFQMVRELGLAVELKLDYRSGSGEVVMADEIEKAIRCLMAEDENPVRKRVKEMGEKSRTAVVDGGSSFASLGRFAEDVLGTV